MILVPVVLPSVLVAAVPVPKVLVVPAPVAMVLLPLVVRVVKVMPEAAVQVGTPPTIVNT